MTLGISVEVAGFTAVPLMAFAGAIGVTVLVYVLAQRGMFSYSGLTKAQVARLRDEYSIYAVDTGRICVAAINSKNVDYIADAVAKVTG